MALTLLGLTNFLFAWKYGSRLTVWAPVMALIFTAGWMYLIARGAQAQKKFRWELWLLSLSFLFLFLLFWAADYFIPLESLQVDRWSVISSFWEEALAGRYPYLARSHMGNYPGPMPFYFILTGPFYFLEMLSFFSALGYLLFLTWLWRRRSEKPVWPGLVLLLGFVPLYWEIAVRSNLFSLSLLVAWSLERAAPAFAKISTRSVLWALALGLLLCTRSIYALPYLLLLSLLWQGQSRGITLFVLGLVLTAGFSLSFLPLWLWFPEEWSLMNPFIVQGSFLVPPYFILLFLAAALALSRAIHHRGDLLFYGGLILWLCIAAYAGYQMLLHGWEAAYFQSHIDISYFLFSAPFFFLYLMRARPDEETAAMRSQ